MCLHFNDYMPSLHITYCVTPDRKTGLTSKHSHNQPEDDRTIRLGVQMKPHDCGQTFCVWTLRFANSCLTAEIKTSSSQQFYSNTLCV